eukprot:TRINITY_DN16913_c0_g1_i1.p1 TRINITY_DN16913_c0_g1~~TRINITY_DN16913_c0_g1_i1.p1  ORF type:complete len:424 (+),score=39.22 TRINITY_DN16913_c0_g1_i1:66-1274(+)
MLRPSHPTIGDSLVETLTSTCPGGIPSEMLPAVKNVNLAGPGDTVIPQGEGKAPIIMPANFRSRTIGFNLETGAVIKATRLPPAVCTETVIAMIDEVGFEFQDAIANFDNSILMSTTDSYPIINTWNNVLTTKGTVKGNTDTAILKISSSLPNEISILSKLQHPCIASCLASSSCLRSCIVNTFEQDSFSFFRDGADFTTCFEYLICILQLLEAISHVHSKGIIHRDINPCCVEISPSNCSLLLSGFCVSTQVEDANKLTGCLSGMNRSFAIPPEMLERRATCSDKSDVYRAGITFQNWLSDKDASLAVKNADIKCLLDFAETLTAAAPGDRPSAKDAFSSASELLQELKIEEAEWHYVEGTENIPSENVTKGTRARISGAMQWLWSKSTFRKYRKKNIRSQ